MLKPLSLRINFTYLHAQNYYISDHFKDFRSRFIVPSMALKVMTYFFLSGIYLIAFVSHFVHSEPKKKRDLFKAISKSVFIYMHLHSYSVGARHVVIALSQLKVTCYK